MKYFLIGIFIFLFAAHIFAILTSAYWSIWWYDNLLHLIGGIAVGMFAIWFIYDLNKIKSPDWSFFFMTVVIISFTSLIGVFWEFFEYFFDKIIAPQSEEIELAQLGLADTLSDLFFDLFGGLLSTIIFRNKIYEHTRKN